MGPQDTEPPTVPEVRDRRPRPTGVLPRHLQTWIMAAIALVIVVIILVTGHSAPTTPNRATAGPRPPALPPTERIRSFQQQLAQEEARLRAGQAATAAEASREEMPTGLSTPPRATVSVGRGAVASSLHADNVVFSRRPPEQQPGGHTPPEDPTSPRTGPMLERSPEEVALRQWLAAQVPTQVSPVNTPATAPVGTPAPLTSSTAAVPTISPARPPAPADVRYLILEGTAIQTVLVNRLEGTFAGPVSCLVTTPVYSHDRAVVLIPPGARLLGQASPVQAWGDARLAVGFHRLVMPDGRTHSLESFKALDQAGEAGLGGDVDRHYWQVFGASIAIGALSGLTQLGTRGPATPEFSDQFRQGLGASLANSGGRVLDRYLNVLPTITVHEGRRVHVYLTKDLELPDYQSNRGGSR